MLRSVPQRASIFTALITKQRQIRAHFLISQRKQFIRVNLAFPHYKRKLLLLIQMNGTKKVIEFRKEVEFNENSNNFVRIQQLV
jgi:hypothetical protein